MEKTSRRIVESSDPKDFQRWFPEICFEKLTSHFQIKELSMTFRNLDVGDVDEVQFIFKNKPQNKKTE